MKKKLQESTKKKLKLLEGILVLFVAFMLVDNFLPESMPFMVIKFILGIMIMGTAIKILSNKDDEADSEIKEDDLE